MIQTIQKNAISYVLAEAKIKLSEVDHIVFYENLSLNSERLVETYVGFSLKSCFKSFSIATFLWLKEKLFQKMLFDERKKQDKNFHEHKKIYFLVEHHLSHAASAFSSPFEEALILTLDG